MQILSNPISALNVNESPKFSRFFRKSGRETQWRRQILDRKWKYGRFVHCNASGHNYSYNCNIHCAMCVNCFTESIFYVTWQLFVRRWVELGCMMNVQMLVGWVKLWMPMTMSAPPARIGLCYDTKLFNERLESDVWTAQCKNFRSAGGRSRQC